MSIAVNYASSPHGAVYTSCLAAIAHKVRQFKCLSAGLVKTVRGRLKLNATIALAKQTEGLIKVVCLFLLSTARKLPRLL